MNTQTKKPTQRNELPFMIIFALVMWAFCHYYVPSPDKVVKEDSDRSAMIVTKTVTSSDGRRVSLVPVVQNGKCAVEVTTYLKDGRGLYSDSYKEAPKYTACASPDAS